MTPNQIAVLKSVKNQLDEQCKMIEHFANNVRSQIQHEERVLRIKATQTLNIDVTGASANRIDTLDDALELLYELKAIHLRIASKLEESIS